MGGEKKVEELIVNKACHPEKFLEEIGEKKIDKIKLKLRIKKICQNDKQVHFWNIKLPFTGKEKTVIPVGKKYDKSSNRFHNKHVFDPASKATTVVCVKQSENKIG